MKILFIAIFLAFGNLTYGQDPGEGLKSNKYFPNKHKTELTGSWISNSDEHLSVDIQVVKRQFSRGDLNFSTDYVILKVNKLLYHGKDIAPSFVNSPIEIMSLNRDNDYTNSFYKDPVTGNTIKITIKYIDPSTIEFSTGFPEMSATNIPEKGKVFPNRVIVLNKVESSIIGAWISEQDSKWKLVLRRIRVIDIMMRNS